MTKRKYPGISGLRPDKKFARRAAEAAREDVWRELTPEQQLNSLDLRLGKDQGAKKQRARLLKLIQEKANG